MNYFLLVLAFFGFLNLATILCYFLGEFVYLFNKKLGHYIIALSGFDLRELYYKCPYKDCNCKCWNCIAYSGEVACKHDVK